MVPPYKLHTLRNDYRQVKMTKIYLYIKWKQRCVYRLRKLLASLSSAFLSPLDPSIPLDTRRKVLGIVALILLVLLFPPVPLRFIG